MAALAAIVLADALATPVNHTFTPQGRDSKGVFWFEDQSNAQALGWSKISIEFKRNVEEAVLPGNNASKKATRVKIGIHLPYLETLGTSDAGFTPAATVAYTPRVFIEFLISERAILQNRKDLLKYASGLLGNTQVVSMVEGLQSLWG